ncbi:MAG TPA: SRPBCC family protein [Dietzia timorensis]|jgi:ribosome-associated toxin RatA of RatAB toxin-antitoxin module|uniref:SRPBCC family protein n=1 Tax=Dietzia timorensis TaxID=499555 RepID=A0A921JX40_9ACTN|nr:SRPBCC family protein [Dietzia timorensis]HJE89597.1 SRPBCC family protein [Dietzia timorensis]
MRDHCGDDQEGEPTMTAEGQGGEDTSSAPLPEGRSASSRSGSSSRGSAQKTATVNADLDTIMSTIADFDNYPDWVPAIRKTSIVSTDDAGRPARVDFVLIAGIVEDEYQLDYSWSEDGTEVRWSLSEPSILQTRQDGSYSLEPGERPGTTDVTYSIDVELTVEMLGRFRERAEKRIINAALEDLAARVEKR